MLFWFILIVSLLLSAALITMVLLQPSKGGGLGASFGGFGGTLGSTFGTRRTLDFLAKGTTWVAIAIALLAIITNKFLTPSTEGPHKGIVTEQGAPSTTPGVPTPGEAIPPGPAETPGAAPSQAAPSQAAPSGGGAQQTPAAPPAGGGK